MKIVLIICAPLLFALALSHAFTSPAYSEDDQPGEFPKDFARDPIQHPEAEDDVKHDDSPYHRLPTATATPRSMTNTPAPGDPSDQSGKVEGQELPDQEVSMERPLDLKKEIVSLGVVVAGNDTPEFLDTVSTLLAKSDELDTSISTIFLVGSFEAYGKLPFADQMEIGMRGGSLKMSIEPPEKFKVAKSPSWIVETKKGLVLLEGAKLPEDKILRQALGTLEKTEEDANVPAKLQREAVAKVKKELKR